MTRLTLSIAIGALGLAAGNCLAQAQKPAAAPIAVPPPALSTPAAVLPPPASTPEGEEVAAIVHAGEETTLSSQMAGKIRRIAVGLGDNVKAGGRIIEFDCTEQQAQLQAAQAEFRGARETHLSRLRLQALGAAGELEVTLAAASADKARSQVVLRESQIAYCHVDAPFSGKTARLRVKVAESVQPNQPLVDLVNPSSLKAQMFVPAAWIAWLKPNLPIRIRFSEGDRSRTVNARISKLNSRVEGVSQQLEVEARFDAGTTDLLPGMVGTAVFKKP